MRALGPLVSTLAVGALMVAGGPRLRLANAQDEGAFDHLQCFPVREGSRSDVERVDVAPRDGIFLDDEGNPIEILDGACKIALPARELCIAADAAPVDPDDAGTTAGPEAGDFLCYTASCGESNARERIVVEDKFGAHRIDVLDRPTRLCVPATRVAGGNPPTPEPTAEPEPSGSPGSATPTPRPIQTPTSDAGGTSPGLTPTPRPILTPPPSEVPVPTLGSVSRAFADPPASLL